MHKTYSWSPTSLYVKTLPPIYLSMSSKAELKSQNPKRLRRKASRDQAYHSAWLSSETMARWQQGDLCTSMPQGILKFLATTTAHEVKASQQFF
jgi:hypothetical protein